mmetsp:Transcript_31870/g.83901  ORF Transcript_31870/g.83901 Transcript_31870/m.83901 type:complete len:121 (+) Transcript_31870:529-891(+)
MPSGLAEKSGVRELAVANPQTVPLPMPDRRGTFWQHAWAVISAQTLLSALSRIVEARFAHGELFSSRVLLLSGHLNPSHGENQRLESCGSTPGRSSDGQVQVGILVLQWLQRNPEVEAST